MNVPEGISVAVESAIHDAFSRCAQNVFDKHRIRVNSINFGWRDESNIEGVSLRVQNIRVDSEMDLA